MAHGPSEHSLVQRVFAGRFMMQWNQSKACFLAFCPLRKDGCRTFRMTLDGRWRCARCGRRGGILDFIERHDRIRREEAVLYHTDLHRAPPAGG